MKAVLILHGIGSSSQGKKVMSIKNKLNMKSFVPDFPQHGDNKQEFNIPLILDEMEKIMMLMKDFDEKYLVARSFGGYIALLILKKYSNFFDKICLLSPAINMNKTMQNMIDDNYITKEFKLKDKQLVSPDYFNKYDEEIFEVDFEKPVLIIQGSEDNVTEFSELEKFLDKNKNAKLKLFPIGHNYDEYEKEILNLVKEWILN